MESFYVYDLIMIVECTALLQNTEVAVHLIVYLSLENTDFSKYFTKFVKTLNSLKQQHCKWPRLYSVE
jgi:hypothetical protein